MTALDEKLLQPVAKLYSESLLAHGTAPKGVGWGDEATHDLRFAKLSAVLDAAPASFSVVDLGCGYGALYGNLIGRGWKVSKFTGYDISDDMLREARRLVTAPEVEFVRSATIDRDADYIFAAGIFNVRLTASETDWRDHILRTLDNINEHSKRGFAFNLLTKYVDWRADHLFYGDPLEFFDHCKGRYSRHVALLHDYPLWEWTMIVRKQTDQDE